MMLTEQEAREKWCPFTRLYIGPIAVSGTPLASAAINRKDNNHCVASHCMAWRWVTSPASVAHENAGLEPQHHTEAKGYCGLAMEPLQ